MLFANLIDGNLLAEETLIEYCFLECSYMKFAKKAAYLSEIS